MSSVQPFAGFNPRPSPWGYNWTAEEVSGQQQQQQQQQHAQVSAPVQRPEPRHPSPDQQLAHMPAALLSTLKREKKPFTYTPGGVNLSEVLEARLQKRMERKKRYCEEVAKNPPKQVVVMPTYNSPLDMYSMQNALEVLEVQAGLVAGDKNLSSPSRSATLPRSHTFRFDDPASDRGVSQSKAFRVLQIMTDTEEDASEKYRPQRLDEEHRFTGLRESSAIPSRFFHNLQKITGTDKGEDEDPHGRTGVVADSHHQQQQYSPAAVSRSQHHSPAPSVPQHRQQQHQQQPPSTGYLKRPAAFLPSNLSSPSGFRPVQPPCSNGPMHHHPYRGNFAPPAVGTDF